MVRKNKLVPHVVNEKVLETCRKIKKVTNLCWDVIISVYSSNHISQYYIFFIATQIHKVSQTDRHILNENACVKRSEK